MTQARQSWGCLDWQAAESRTPAFPPPFEIKSAQFCNWSAGSRPQPHPEVLGLQMLCCVSPTGERAFRPINDEKKPFDRFRRFFSGAWGWGFPILAARPDFDRYTRNSYRAMWFLFQKFHHTKSFITRRFNSAMDLKKAGLKGRKEVLLPWPVDDWHRLRGYPQSVKELLELGRSHAGLSGIARPSTAQKIHFALAVAAQIDDGGGDLSHESIRKRIKYALLDMPDRPSGLTPDLEMEIEGRILEVLWSHVDSDQSQPDLQEWCWGGSNSFVKQVAQGLSDWAIADATDFVWYVIFDLGFRSYDYVGGCIQALMRDIARCLEPPLSERESADFANMYYGQPHFGGLPLILLADKLEFCEGLLGRLVTDPADAAAHRALHRLLFYYGELARLRREADRERKAARRDADRKREALRAPRRPPRPRDDEDEVADQ